MMYKLVAASAIVASAESSLSTVGSPGRPSIFVSTLSTSEPEKPPCSLETVTKDAPA